MGTMIDYLDQYGSLSFSQAPLSVVDAAILAQLAYCNFAPHTTGRLEELTLAQQAALVAGTWQEAGNRRLLAWVAASPRFAGVSWFAAVNHHDPNRQQEFSAVTFRLTADTYYLAFRGTRASFVDWKEDLNMTFLPAIPSQQAALAYFTTIAQAHPGHYYLGGHSKGGTLATYAFAFASPGQQAAVRCAYNFDGPGLRNPWASPKLLKLVPEASVIGMILDPGQDFGVVASRARGLRQHDLLSWTVRARDFVYLPATSARSRHTQQTLATWLNTLDDDTKQRALDAAYQVVANTQATTFAELKATPTHTAKALLAGLHATDAADHEAWRTVVAHLARTIVAERTPKH